MKRIDSIKNKIEKLNSQKPETVILKPVISLEQVKAFEEKYQITLPKDYVEFITQIGDGATIQSETFGKQQITSLRRYEREGYPLDKIGQPFQLTKGWMPWWGDDIEGMEDMDDVDEDTMDELIEAQMDMIDTCGHIVIMDEDADDFAQWILIVKGPRAGEVWCILDSGVQRLIKCGFLRWLDLYLSGKIDDFMAECREKEYPQNPDFVEQCKKVIKKQRIVMNPPISREEVSVFEKRHKIQLPEEYVTFLTEIGNGAKKVSWPGSWKIYSLEEIDSLEDLDKPFLIQTEKDYKRIFEDETGRERYFYPRLSDGEESLWKWLEKQKILNEEMKQKMFNRKETKYPWALPQFQIFHGCMPIIGNKQDDYVWQYVLILNGVYRGQVWKFANGAIWPIRNTEMAMNALTIIEAVAFGV